MRTWLALAMAGCLLAAGCDRKEGEGAPAPVVPDGAKPGPRTGPAGPASAEIFWQEWKKAVAAGDGRGLWGMTCAANKKAFVDKTRASLKAAPDTEWARMASITKIPQADLKAMPPEALAEVTTIAMLDRMRDQPEERDKVERSTLIGVEGDERNARIRFRMPDGRELSVVVVREDGQWKADLAASGKFGSGH